MRVPQVGSSAHRALRSPYFAEVPDVGHVAVLHGRLAAPRVRALLAPACTARSPPEALLAILRRSDEPDAARLPDELPRPQKVARQPVTVGGIQPFPVRHLCSSWAPISANAELTSIQMVTSICVWNAIPNRPTFAPMAGEELAVRFGALVRRRRLERGLSQERLAELSGLHRNYVGAVERAERTPPIVQADRLARALGTTLAEIFGEIDREVGSS